LVRVGALTLDIIGDGPLMPELKGMVERENLAGGVNLAGWVKHSELGSWLANADVFAFPSVREFGGAVALEAMATGVVPIVVAYGGPAELVTPKTGYLIPIGPRQQIIADVRRILEELVAHPEQIESKSGPALRRAREQFTWEAKAKQVIEVYRWVLDRSFPKPQFPMPAPDLND